MEAPARTDRYSVTHWAGEEVRSPCPACRQGSRRLILALPTSADLSDPRAITYAFTCDCGNQWGETRTLPKSRWPRAGRTRAIGEPNALYRFWNADGVLLYVGITADPGARWKAHSKDKPWWAEVVKVTVEHFDSREAVEAAEVAAIKAEKPLHNIVHNRLNTARRPESTLTIAGDAPTGSRRWTFHNREYGVPFTSPLWLYWEVDFEAITDDYLPDEIDARELWDLWRRTYPFDKESPDGMVPIWWYVAGEQTFDWAPFQDHMDLYRDFLTEFTWPRDPKTDEPLRWTALPVIDKLWRSGPSPRKGGFIQEVTGWKPAPLQPYMDVRLLERAALL